MASRATSYWRTMVHRVGGNRSFTTSTTPKSKAFAAPLHDMFGAGRNNSKAAVRGDFVPVYVALGMIALSVSLGLLTAKHQLLYAPNVYVKKKRRKTVPEVVEPDSVVDEAERFIHKSLFRRLAHVQEFDRVLDDPIRGYPLVVPEKVESLKTVGVDPAKY
ncbi:uncharacterized protein [Aristolochia californica]|uniref:uncharacterized protein n=1 Tax=Aristolochia californica TaxID=171875 RepID=UPI0035D55CEB